MESLHRHTCFSLIRNEKATTNLPFNMNFGHKNFIFHPIEVMFQLTLH